MTAAASNPTQPTLHALAEAVRQGRTAHDTYTRESLRRIEAAQELNAVLRVVDVEEQLRALRQRLDAGEHLPLAGVPVIVKDNLSLRGATVSCASRMLEHYQAPYTAAAVERLQAAGAVVVAQANMDEFAMGSSTENSAFGPTLNPWDTERVPGGSSGGSAAALAARLAPLTIGSDTGGSVRQPASLCGVYGLKPTYGRISRYGLVAYASSLDSVGAFGLSAADLALSMDVLAGHDPRDATSLPDRAEWSAEPLELAGLRVGVVTQGMLSMTEGVSGTLSNMRGRLEGAGASVREVSLEALENATATYYLIAMAEASSNLARFDGMHYGARVEAAGAVESITRTREEYLGREVQERIMLGTFVLSSGYSEAYYTKALQVRRLISDAFASAFADYDVLLTPTSPFPAFGLGEKKGDPLAMYAADVNTVGVNLAGIPALSVPAGFEVVDGKRLPIGLQFMAPVGEDARLIRLAAALEAVDAVQAEVPAGYTAFGAE